MTRYTHFIVITARKARAACGLSILAFYPMSNMAQVWKTYKLVNVSLDAKHVDCPDCLKKLLGKRKR